MVFPPPLIFQIPSIFCSEKNYTTRNNYRHRDILMLLHVLGNLPETILGCVLCFSQLIFQKSMLYICTIISYIASMAAQYFWNLVHMPFKIAAHVGDKWSQVLCISQMLQVMQRHMRKVPFRNKLKLLINSVIKILMQISQFLRSAL